MSIYGVSSVLLKLSRLGIKNNIYEYTLANLIFNVGIFLNFYLKNAFYRI